MNSPPIIGPRLLPTTKMIPKRLPQVSLGHTCRIYLPKEHWSSLELDDDRRDTDSGYYDRSATKSCDRSSDDKSGKVLSDCGNERPDFEYCNGYDASAELRLKDDERTDE